MAWDHDVEMAYYRFLKSLGWRSRLSIWVRSRWIRMTHKAG